MADNYQRAGSPEPGTNEYKTFLESEENKPGLSKGAEEIIHAVVFALMCAATYNYNSTSQDDTTVHGNDVETKKIMDLDMTKQQVKKLINDPMMNVSEAKGYAQRE